MILYILFFIVSFLSNSAFGRMPESDKADSTPTIEQVAPAWSGLGQLVMSQKSGVEFKVERFKNIYKCSPERFSRVCLARQVKVSTASVMKTLDRLAGQGCKAYNHTIDGDVYSCDVGDDVVIVRVQATKKGLWVIDWLTSSYLRS